MKNLLTILIFGLLLSSFTMQNSNLKPDDEETPGVIVIPGLLYMCGGEGEIFTDCDPCETCICEIIIFADVSSNGNLTTYIDATVTFHEITGHTTTHFDEVIVNSNGDCSQCEGGGHESALNITHRNIN